MPNILTINIVQTFSSSKKSKTTQVDVAQTVQEGLGKDRHHMERG